MGIFRQFPYSNFHEMNMDYLLKIVREWVDKTDLYFKDTDEAIELIHANFDELVAYVDSYFENLDVRSVVQAILDEWLEDGTIEEILQGDYVMYDQFHQQFFDGNLVIRNRSPYETGDLSRAIQNGCIYSPDGDYSKNNPNNRIYAYKGSSDDSILDLLVFSMDNELLNTISVPNMGHGGCLTIKDNNMYCLSYSGMLTVFDLTNSSSPVITEQRQTSLISSYIIGANEHGFVGIKQDTVGNKLTIYQINNSITSDTLMYELEGGLTGLFQDACVDILNNRIYWLSYEPNVIHIHSYSDGSQIMQMVIPDAVGYVSVGEAEFIDIKNNHMYLGAFQGTGTAIDHNLDFRVWHTTPQSLGDNSRKVALNLAGYRDISVRYQTQDGLNGNVEGLNGSIVFKYIEDAQICAKFMNGAVRININEDYAESWQMHQNADYVFINNSKTAPFVINPNVIADVRNIGGFLRTPNTYDSIPCWITIRDNADITFNNITELDVGTTNMLIYAVRCKVTILSAVEEMHNLALRSAILNAVAGIGSQFHANGSILNVPYLNGAKYSSQYISTNCQLKCRLQDGATQRPTIIKLADGTVKSPAQFTFYPRSMTALGLRPLEPVYGYKGSAGATTLTMGMYKNDTWSNYSVDINRDTVTPRFSSLGGTYYRYYFSNYSETYALIGVSNINA